MKNSLVQILLSIVALCAVQAVSAALLDDFVITVKTDNNGVSANNQFTIPTIGIGYKYSVDCNNDDINEINNTNGDYTCSYSTAGTYTIRIKHNNLTGEGFPLIHFNFSGDRLKILSLDQWGTGHWTSFANAFYGCSNMLTLATDSPNLVSVASMSLRNMFRNATAANPDTSGWDTSQVTDMSGMFADATAVNPDTSGWDTSQVVDMSSMFTFARAANPDTSGWDTSKVTDMFAMFQAATVANPDTSGWDTSQVTDMRAMFDGATAANPDTSGWNTSQVMNMSRMFRIATAANPDTSGWDTSQVTNMSAMFVRATSANPNTSNWDTSQVTDMSDMFLYATLANPDTGSWNTSKVTSMFVMFAGATLANPDTSSWNTTNVTNMGGMFRNSVHANPNTSSWITTNVTYFHSMFLGAISANPDTSNWDIANVLSMDLMFDLVTLPTADYDALLIDFNNKPHQATVSFSGGFSLYCSTSAQMARAELIGSDGWVISDGGLCAPVVADLVAASDSGLSTTDDITNDNTPELAVSCSLAGNEIQLYSDNAVIATHTCAGVGFENSTSTVVLSDGVHQVSYQQRNIGGQFSALGVALPITIDTMLATPVCTTSPANAQQGTAVTTTCTAVEQGALLTIDHMNCLPISAPASGVVSCNGVVGLNAGEVVQSNDTVMTVDVAGNVNNNATTGLLINFLPQALDDVVTLNEDAAMQTIAVLSNDSDIEGDNFVIASVNQPSNGVVVNNTTDLSYIPHADYCNNGITTDDFSYEITGGAVATVSVTVNCVNDAPSFVPTCSNIDASAYAGVNNNNAQFYNFSLLTLGPINENSQNILGFTLNLTDPQGVISQLSIDGDGYLSVGYSLQTGVATLGITIQDDGGIALGGNDTSLEQEFFLSYSDLSSSTDRILKSSFEFSCESVSLDIVQ